MPDISLSSIGQLEIGGESEYGSTTSNFEFVQCLTADLSGLTAASLRNDALRQGDTEAARITGIKTGTMTTTHYLHGWSTSVPTAAPSFKHPTSAANGWDVLMSIVARGLGGITVGSYNGTDTVGATGSPTDTITVANAGDGLSNWAEGECIAWATADANTPYEIGYIKALANEPTDSPNTGTLLQTPAYDPQGSKVWGGYTIFKKTGDPYVDVTNAPASYSVKYTRDDGTVCTAIGCVPTQITFNMTAGELPTMTLEWAVSSWTETTGGTLTQQNMLNSTGDILDGSAVPVPEAVTQWLVRWGSGTGVKDITTGSVEITMGLEVQPIAGGYSDGGIEDFFTSKRNPMVTVRMPRAFADEVTDWEDQTGEPLQVQIGSQPGRMWGCALPVARVMERPASEDENGAIYATVQFYPCLYDGDSGTVDDESPIDSDMRIVWV